MNYNKFLGYFTLSILATSTLAVLAVNAWEDHPDFGFIDHVTHFHIDHERIYHEAMEERRQALMDREDRLRFYTEFNECMGTNINPGDSKWGTMPNGPERD